MNNKKADLRVQKTQQALALALIKLLQKYAFTKIHVNEICAEALVSRSAFYANFEDKYHLLKFCITMFHTKLTVDVLNESLKTQIHHMLTHIQADVIIFKHLLLNDHDVQLTNMMLDFFQKNIEKHLVDSNCQIETFCIPVDIYTVYYASAITNTIAFWINKNMPYSVDDMASYLYTLLPQPINQLCAADN